MSSYETWLRVLFVVGAGLAFYTVAGYPVVLAVLARSRKRTVRKTFVPRTVTVILPVKNGACWIEQKLRSLLEQNYPPELVEILVISDASTDATDDVVRAFEASGRVRLVRVPPGGKALAINAGMSHARGDLLFFTDVRQELLPDTLRCLNECLADPEVGAVTGELIIRKGETLEEESIGAYWKYEKWIRRNQSQRGTLTGVTGCVYMVPRTLATPLPAGTVLDDMYLPMTLVRRGYKLVFEERAVALDFPTRLDSEFGRKVRTQAGVYQLIRWCPWLLTPSNPILFHFLSHKVARLLLPWALVVVAISTYALPEPWRTLAGIGQFTVYGLAAVDLLLPQQFVLKRISSPARSFVVLLAAAAVAVRGLYTPTDVLWKETRVSSAGDPSVDGSFRSGCGPPGPSLRG